MNDNGRTLLIRNGSVLTCAAPVSGARGADLAQLRVIHGGTVTVSDGWITAVEADDGAAVVSEAETLDAEGGLVTPGLVDPHSHLVHGGSRAHELEARVSGASTGLATGIASTAERTAAASDQELVERALRDLDVMLAHGTTTLEAKTGYGFTRDEELRLLRLTAGLRHAVDVVPTYLGAHVVPPEYARRRDAFVDLVIETLAEAREHAEHCDVACDPGSFTRAECERIAEAAGGLGYGLHVHADQTGDADGARFAARAGALSADHLDHVSETGVRALAQSSTVAVLLPGVTLHMLEMTPGLRNGALMPPPKPFMPLVTRRLIDAGACVALSCDYNPGSCPSPSMQLMMQLGARLFRLSTAEAWYMATLNAAAALGLAADRGSLEPGKRADIVVWRVKDPAAVLDRFGVNLVAAVLKDGRVVARSEETRPTVTGGA
jgi:imidazolonepropionase